MVSGEVERGHASVWVQDPEGDPRPLPVGMHEPFIDPEVILLDIVTSTTRFSVMFNRGEFSRMLASPNGGVPIETAVTMTEFT